MKYIFLILFSISIYPQSREVLLLMSDEGLVIPSYLTDSNARGWYDASDATTITLVGSEANIWADKSGQGNDLAFDPNVGTGSAIPGYVNGELTFNGIEDRLKTATYTLGFPITIYAVIKIITYTSGSVMLDGYTGYNGAFQQAGTSPRVRLYSGGAIVTCDDMDVGSYNIIRIVWQPLGTNSSLQVDDNVAVTENVGADHTPAGVTIGSDGNGGAPAAISVKELIIRAGADDAPTQTILYDYLKTKHGL